MREIKKLINSKADTSEALDAIDDVIDVLNNVTEDQDYEADVNYELETTNAKMIKYKEQMDSAGTDAEFNKFKNRYDKAETENKYYKKIQQLQGELKTIKSKKGDDKDKSSQLAEKIKALKVYIKEENPNKGAESAESAATITTAGVQKYIDGIIEEMIKVKGLPKETAFAPIFKSDFAKLFDGNSVRTTAPSGSKEDEITEINEMATKLKNMITKDINPAIHTAIKTDDRLKDQVNIKKIKDINIIPNYVDKLDKLIGNTSSPKSGGKYTRKSSPFSMMKYVSNMMPKRKTQKRHHRKH